jgi:drug/metabolite transporter (DMT)-like permease
VRRIGASRAAIASAIGPPATAVMAVLVQDEILSLFQGIGMIMVIAAILWLELRQENSKIGQQLK